nr:MAG TPA: hypothetical protein [Caudoviricetes sp.]
MEITPPFFVSLCVCGQIKLTYIIHVHIHMDVNHICYAHNQSIKFG